MKLFARRCLPAVLLLTLAGCGGSDNAYAPSTKENGNRAGAALVRSAADYEPMLQNIYVAYFGRPADPAGLAFWAEQWRAAKAPLTLAEVNNTYASNASVKELVDVFGTSQESRELYAGDNASFITAIYRNLFNRDPDVPGKLYWAEKIDSGALTRPIAAIAIMAGAANSDATIIANKLVVAANFSAALNSQQLLDAYSGNAANAISRSMLGKVGAATVPASFQSEIETTRASLVTALAATLRVKQLQVMASRPSAYEAPAPAWTIADVLGTYRRVPDDGGDWSSGTITVKDADSTTLLWTNKAGFKWTLRPDVEHNVLVTDSSNPYFTSSGGQNFALELGKGKVMAFTFLGSLFARDNSMALASSTGMASYFNFAWDKTQVAATYAYGFSLYTAIWPAVDQALENFQIGYPGTWLNPDNEDYAQALVPANHPFAGSPYDPYSRLFQTIEGSAGYWGSTRFPSAGPKYRINGTPNGYQNELSSPGWGFGSDALAAGQGTAWALPMGSAGLAQMSNRLLMPPDGWTFKTGTAGEFFGLAWLALPLTQAKTGSTPVGDQSWTAFVNASNFQGPVGFYLPDVWTILSRTYPAANGRGLDARPATISHFAMEYGHMPFFQAKDTAGASYLRLPHLRYPTDGNATTYLATDFVLYSKAALFQPLKDWLGGGAAVSGKFAGAGMLYPQMQADPIYMWKGGTDIQIASSKGLDDYVRPGVVRHATGASAWTFQWKGSSSDGSFPEYFKKQGDYYSPVAASTVPEETGLKTPVFPAAGSAQSLGAYYASPNSWGAPAPVAGPFTTVLVDGSTVTYSWYRFIEQPSLQGFGWSTEEKAALQAVIEKLHGAWGSSQEFILPPSIGSLATLDAALLVVPPKGLERGYVPIVTRQQR